MPSLFATLRARLPAGIICLTLLAVAGCGTSQPNSRIIQSQTRSADGMVMVYVPAGEFLMGSADTDLKAAEDEQPQHTVYLDAFWIDRTEVTNLQYAAFLNAWGDYRGRCGGRDCIETKVEDHDSHILLQEGRFAVEPGFEDHPVVEVTWHGSQAYCEWAGVRLPTEAEWEKAARGTSGQLYPWGDGRPNCSRAQYGDCEGKTEPVGTRPAGASPYGAQDMSGNVWEWVADWYDAGYYASSPPENPPGPDSGERRAFRGGSWGYPGAFIRAADRARNRPEYAGFNLGFRCAADAPP
jgi:formylglycine-generating enzyme required for sulfatase activity